MKRIALSIHNSLMALSIAHALRHDGGFLVSDLRSTGEIALECAQLEADILLMETTYGIGATLEDRLRQAERLRKLRPQCKVILLCDENSVPEIARQVVLAKRDGHITDFIYSSVSETYLTALLSSM